MAIIRKVIDQNTDFVAFKWFDTEQQEFTSGSVVKIFKIQAGVEQDIKVEGGIITSITPKTAESIDVNNILDNENFTEERLNFTPLTVAERERLASGFTASGEQVFTSQVPPMSTDVGGDVAETETNEDISGDKSFFDRLQELVNAGLVGINFPSSKADTTVIGVDLVGDSEAGTVQDAAGLDAGEIEDAFAPIEAKFASAIARLQELERLRDIAENEQEKLLIEREILELNIEMERLRQKEGKPSFLQDVSGTTLSVAFLGIVLLVGFFVITRQ